MDSNDFAQDEDVLRVSIQQLETGALDTRPASLPVNARDGEERDLDPHMPQDADRNRNGDLDRVESGDGVFSTRREAHLRDSRDSTREWRRAMDSGRPFGALGHSDIRTLSTDMQILRLGLHQPEPDTRPPPTPSVDGELHKTDPSDELKPLDSLDTLEHRSVREPTPLSSPPALDLDGGSLPPQVNQLLPTAALDSEPAAAASEHQHLVNGDASRESQSEHQEAPSSPRPLSPSQLHSQDASAADDHERRPRVQSAKKVRFARANREGVDGSVKTERRASAAESDDGGVLVYVREIPGRHAVVEAEPEDLERNERERERERDFREQLLAQSSPQRTPTHSQPERQEKRPNGILKREPTVDGEEATAEEATHEKPARHSPSHQHSPSHKTVANGTANNSSSSSSSFEASWLASMSNFQHYIQQNSKSLKTPLSIRSSTDSQRQRLRRSKTASASTDSSASNNSSQSPSGLREKGSRARGATDSGEAPTTSSSSPSKAPSAAGTTGKGKRSTKADREPRPASRAEDGGGSGGGGGGTGAGAALARANRNNWFGSDSTLSRSLTWTATNGTGSAGDVQFGVKSGRVPETSSYLLSVDNFRAQPPFHAGAGAEALPPIHSERDRERERSARRAQWEATSAQWSPAHPTSNGPNGAATGMGSCLDQATWHRSYAWHLANGHMKPQTCSISQLW